MEELELTEVAAQQESLHYLHDVFACAAREQTHDVQYELARQPAALTAAAGRLTTAKNERLHGH